VRASLGATVGEAKKPTPSARKIRPESSADSRRPFCRYSASTRKKEAIAEVQASMVARPTEKARSRNIVMLMSGTPPCRASALLACRSCSAEGTATLTIKKSSVVTNTPARMTARVPQCGGDEATGSAVGSVGVELRTPLPSCSPAVVDMEFSVLVG
jgi:hypothetical protein